MSVNDPAVRARIEALKAEVDEVPTLPGVYLWKDASGQVIYVGKAKQLRARMRQYLNLSDERAKIPVLVEQIHSFDYIVVENEHEALVLEKNLINRHAPFFNADFKDGKSYPFIALSKTDPFPALKYTREKHRPDVRYFGPFTDSRAARDLIDIARRVVPLCVAGCPTWRKINKRCADLGVDAVLEQLQGERPCFDASVGLAPGVCSGCIAPEEYAENVARVTRFLQGSHREFVEELEADMAEASAELDFERAARIKKRIDVIKGVGHDQHATSVRDLNADVVGFFREETIAGVQVLQVREGRVMNANEFILNRGLDVSGAELAHNFLLRYYDVSESIPHEVYLEELPEDAEAIEEWLSGKLKSAHGAKVRLSVPQKGEKHALLEMAQRNARHALLRYKVRSNYDDKRLNDALAQLESALALDGPPMRIECYDISTIHGSYTVASMVVFSQGRPDKKAYRRFKVRAELDEANDFLSMREVLSRRFAPKRLEDGRFGAKPDLVILDGGLPQLAAVQAQFEEMGVTDVALCALAKRDEELFVPWQGAEPIVLPGGSASLYLVKQLRDEAHRFAIGFHRELRGKGMTNSVLDEIPGLGPKRKERLIRHFGSFKRLTEASAEEIAASKAVPAALAEEVAAVLDQYLGARERLKGATLGDDASEPGDGSEPTDGSAPAEPTAFAHGEGGGDDGPADSDDPAADSADIAVSKPDPEPPTK